MSLNRSVFSKWIASGALVAGAMLAVPSANAATAWSLGINLPGVAVGVAEPGPVYYEPAPVYVSPPPVYYRPPPPPVYYRPAPPVYYGPPAAVYYEPEYRRGYRHHHRRDWDDRQ